MCLKASEDAMRLGEKAVFDFSELAFPNRLPNFVTRICNGVLNVDEATFLAGGANEQAQFLAILKYANRRGEVQRVIKHCRTWSTDLSDAIDRFLAQLGSTADQVMPGPIAFFDREDLRNHLEDVLDPNCNTRIVVIKGPSPSGKSYSFKLISRVGKGLAGANPQEVPLVDYTQDPALEPIDLMESIARLLSIPQTEMPRSKRAQDSRIVIKLTEWFVGAFNKRGDSTKPVWLCLDGFHLKGCPQWAVDFAVNLAIPCANGSIDNLVLFLVGFDDTKLPSQCDGIYRAEDVTPFSPDHVWTFVKTYAKAQKLTIDDTSKTSIIDWVFKDIPAQADHAQMRLVAQRSIKIVDEIKQKAKAAAAAAAPAPPAGG
jgi:hypothetical protein